MGSPQFEVFYRRRLIGGRIRWYWRLRAENGEIVARSSESYTRASDARRGALDARRAAEQSQAEIVEV